MTGIYIPFIDTSKNPDDADRVQLGQHITDECIAFIEHQNMFTEEVIKDIAKMLERDYKMAIRRGEFPWEVQREILERLERPQPRLVAKDGKRVNPLGYLCEDD